MDKLEALLILTIIQTTITVLAYLVYRLTPIETERLERKAEPKLPRVKRRSLIKVVSPLPHQIDIFNWKDHSYKFVNKGWLLKYRSLGEDIIKRYNERTNSMYDFDYSQLQSGYEMSDPNHRLLKRLSARSCSQYSDRSDLFDNEDITLDTLDTEDEFIDMNLNIDEDNGNCNDKVPSKQELKKQMGTKAPALDEEFPKPFKLSK